jgi:hypothetical protein
LIFPADKYLSIKMLKDAESPGFFRDIYNEISIMPRFCAGQIVLKSHGSEYSQVGGEKIIRYLGIQN